MHLFHGTSADAAKRILRDGFDTEAGGENWTVSGNAIYFWSKEKLIEAGELGADDSDWCFASRAFEAAQFALAFSQDCRAVVFEAELPDSDMDDDFSCENMSGAVCTVDNVPPSAIRGAWVTNDLSLLRGYFLAMHLERDLSARQLDKLQEKIARIMQKAEIYPDDVEEIADMRKISLDELRVILGMSV
jgi:hypothetical protein